MWNEMTGNVYRERKTFSNSLSDVTGEGLPFCLPKPNKGCNNPSVSCKFAGRFLSTEVTKTDHWMHGWHKSSQGGYTGKEYKLSWGLCYQLQLLNIIPATRWPEQTNTGHTLFQYRACTAQPNTG